MKTQHEFILYYLLKYGSISSMEAFDGLGITKLATRISELKDLGFCFDQKMETCINRHGTEVRFMRYWINEEHCTTGARMVLEKVRGWTHG